MRTLTEPHRSNVPRFLARRMRASALAAALVLASCAPGANLVPLPANPLAGYQLGPGDQVRVITFGGEQLTGDFRVSDSNQIAIPLLGLVSTRGLTAPELSGRIASELRERKLFHEPSVSVEVVAFRPFFILGEVAKPGQYPFQPGMTVLTAVSIAGGFTYRAVTGYQSIVRTVGQHGVEGKVTRQSVVEPGDVINVFERRF